MRFHQPSKLTCSVHTLRTEQTEDVNVSLAITAFKSSRSDAFSIMRVLMNISKNEIIGALRAKTLSTKEVVTLTYSESALIELQLTTV